MTMAIANKIAAGAFTVEDLLALNRIVSRNTVVETRNDDKMRVDASISLLDSKLDGALTKIIAASQNPRIVTKWKAITGLAISFAATMGVVTASCMNGYQTARFEAVEPAIRAEEKAQKADAKVQEVSKELERRIAESETRHDQTEKKLTDIERSLNTANSVLISIAQKLEDSSNAPKKTKPR